jgi:CheY-like chemotaxis protein
VNRSTELRTKRVLVVDDEPAVRALVVASLAGSDYEVATAMNGAAAFTAIDDGLPDLILLDLALPGMSGRDILASLRADPRTVAIPVVFLTGGEPPAGAADGVLAKPFTPITLRESVATFIA